MSRIRRSLACVALTASCAAPAVGAETDAASAGTRRFTELVARAIAYEHGEGVPKNSALAAQLYCEAARNGDAEAHFGLGWMYANGRGVARDDRIAATLFVLAAAQGHVHAQRLLGYFTSAADRLPECMRLPVTRPASAQETADPFAELPPRLKPFADLVRELAPEYEIDPVLALAIVAVESRFQPRALSPKGARGLMQLMPATAKRFEVRDAFDSTANVRGGLAYLRWLLAYYQGRLPLVLAAYNAGENAVDRHRGVPPYAETRNYVRLVLGVVRAFAHPFDPSVTEPSRSIFGAAREPGAARP